MLFTLDGCVPEINAMLNIADNDLQSDLPESTIVLKHCASGTALFQAADAGKLHSILKSCAHEEKFAIKEYIDDALIPEYMDGVYELLRKYRFKPGAQRQYYKFFANIENWLKIAFTDTTIRSSYANSVQWPWDLRKWMSKWVGADSLQPADFDKIIDILPKVIELTSLHGGVHRTAFQALFGEFIYEKHRDGLSEDAIMLLLTQEMKKPVEQRPFNQWGAWILTHPDFLQLRRIKAMEHINKQAEIVLNENDKKKLELLNARELDNQVKILYEMAANDIKLNTPEEQRKWKKPKKNIPFDKNKDVYQAAWKKYVQSEYAKILPTTLTALVNSLNPIFEAKYIEDAQDIEDTQDVGETEAVNDIEPQGNDASLSVHIGGSSSEGESPDLSPVILDELPEKSDAVDVKKVIGRPKTKKNKKKKGSK
jgi:hypothetical protein